MGTWSGYQKHLQHRSWSASTCLDSGSFVSAFCFAVFAATTRKDAIGDAARSTGNAAISTFESAKTINNEHNITVLLACSQSNPMLGGLQFAGEFY